MSYEGFLMNFSALDRRRRHLKKIFSMLQFFCLIFFSHYGILSGIVGIVRDCYIGGCSSIPTHSDSIGKWMYLRPDQPMPCEGNRVISSKCWRNTYIVSLIAKMGFSAPAIQPYRNRNSPDCFSKRAYFLSGHTITFFNNSKRVHISGFYQLTAEG